MEFDRSPQRSWQVAWAILFAALALTVVFITAESKHIIVLDVDKVDIDVMMLAAATVVLTGVAVVAGIGALWGYGELKKAAVAEAIKQSLVVAERAATDRADQIVPRLIQARLHSAISTNDESVARAFLREPETDNR